MNFLKSFNNLLTPNHRTLGHYCSKVYIDFSQDDQLEFAFDELLRTLHDAPLFVKPPIGNKPFTPITSTPVERTGDPILTLMKVVVEDFNQHDQGFTNYGKVRAKSGMSRLMLDSIIAKAVSEGYLTQDRDKDLRLTDKGKRYAFEHNLV